MTAVITSEVAGERWVGPVLTSSPLGGLLVDVLLKQNPKAIATNRGAYVRVLVPTRCVLQTAAVEELTGSEFVLPTALEAVMPSFQGRLRWADGEVEWT